MHVCQQLNTSSSKAYETNMKVTPFEISKITDGGTIFTEDVKSTTATPRQLPSTPSSSFRCITSASGVTYSAVELEIDHLYIPPVTAPQFEISRRGHFYFVDIDANFHSNQADQRARGRNQV